jgi:hypothetical protein
MKLCATDDETKVLEEATDLVLEKELITRTIRPS